MSGPIAAVSNSYLVWSRLQTLHEWWQWPAVLSIVLCAVAAVVWMYRRDTVELPRWTGLTLLVLRVTALAVLVLFFFGLERRTEERSVRNSRLAILVDNSQSMGLADDSENQAGTRLDRVLQLFERPEWWSNLQQDHEIVVYSTGESETAQMVGMFPYAGAPPAEMQRDPMTLPTPSRDERSSTWAAVLMGVGVVLFLAFLWQWFQGDEVSASHLVAAAVGLLGISAVALAWTDIQRTPPEPLPEPTTLTSSDLESQPAAAAPEWSNVLTGRQGVTRLGDSLSDVLQQNRGQPLAGLIVFTDGAQNAGRDAREITQVAKQQTVPLFPVGLGTTQLPRNVVVADLQLPPRIFPEDQFNATVYLQASQMSGRQVEVRLFASPVDETAATATSDSTTEGAAGDPREQLIDTQTTTLGADYQFTTVRFQLEPPATGTWSYRAVVAPIPQELDESDNQLAARVTVVDRKTRVLLFAGGPTREYQFLRNQLFRDPSMNSDVLLQTALTGSAQESQQVLSAFPSTADELFEYDCIAAFDPDWSQLTRDQLELMERWVSEEAGGLLLVAGPVNTHRWAETSSDDTAYQSLRSLYPVQFYRRGSASSGLGRTAGVEPWPLQFSREGAAARFLWIGDSQEESSLHWSEFPGFYSYFAVKEIKPGATVYASFSDPETAIRGTPPPLIVGQYYGAGRSLFLSSGELWRLREIDVSFQEQLYTKLIRYVSEGRLERDSDRGSLILDKQKCGRGERVVVRAQIKDPQRQPLRASSVEALLSAPDGTRRALDLPSSPETDGVFQGFFVAELPGTYVVSLELPGPDAVPRLTREVQVRLADKELEHPLREDAMLGELARETRGAYYVGIPALQGERGVPAISQRIHQRQQVNVVEGAADMLFDRLLMKWFMILLCGSLCLEWLVRRLHRLA